MADHVGRLVEAAKSLTIQPRQFRWTHLSLCVLEAVYSIDANYDRVTVPLVRAYAGGAESLGRPPLADPLLPVGRAREVIGTDREQPLGEFLGWANSLGAEKLADELGNHQPTSRSRSAPLKSQAVIEYSQILVDHAIQTIDSAAALLMDDAGQRPEVESRLRRVAGNGQHDIRLNYLWMLIGDDTLIKPDRMVLRWIAAAVKPARPPSVSDARTVITQVAGHLGCTPWELDHAIWTAQRQIRTPQG